MAKNMIDEHKRAMVAISETMKTFYGCGYSLSDAIDRLENVQNELRQVIWDIRDRDNDYRCGEDVYGYDSAESILLNLQYVSDRWGTAGRLSWLLGLVDPDFGPGSRAIRELEKEE
tara:strand:+ start:174 stop:521 length:348 start_codon:yes stop_codon:yes gene_type:complete